MKGNTILHDEACEQNILGVVLRYNEYYHTMTEILTPQMFYSHTHLIICKIIANIINNGDVADEFNVFAKCQAKGEDISIAYLSELTAEARTTANFAEHCRRLAQLFERRELVKLGQRLTEAAADPTQDMDTVTASAIKSLQDADNPAKQTSTMEDADTEFNEMLTAQATGTGIGINTPFSCISCRGGLCPSTLTLIAAKSSHGKSALALNIAIDAAIEGFPVVYYSLEMSKGELYAREIARQTQLPLHKITTGYNDLSQPQRIDIDEARRQIRKLPVFFDDSVDTSIEGITASIRRMRRKHGIKLAVVDYLQMIPKNPKDKGTEETALAAAARALKNVALKEKICVIALSQFSRGEKNEKEPNRDLIRGSGQILEAADNCVILYRPHADGIGAKYSGQNANVDPVGTAQLTIAKWRNGSTGEKAIIGFRGEQCEFYELDTMPRLAQQPKDNSRPF